MLLNYVALVILIMGLLLVFYGFIYIHDIPYAIAKKRHHPHKEAIHVACWLSLFTLHAIWPIVYIWAVYKPGPVRVSIVTEEPDAAGGPAVDGGPDITAELQLEVERLREQVRMLELEQSHSRIESQL